MFLQCLDRFCNAGTLSYREYWLGCYFSHCTHADRMQGAQVTEDSLNYLIGGVYLPALDFCNSRLAYSKVLREFVLTYSEPLSASSDFLEVRDYLQSREAHFRGSIIISQIRRTKCHKGAAQRVRGYACASCSGVAAGFA